MKAPGWGAFIVSSLFLLQREVNQADILNGQDCRIGIGDARRLLHAVDADRLMLMTESVGLSRAIFF
ncbi:MAG: hypothetical protein ACSW8D_04005 [Prevotella sp.]|jgi:hypothetical protein